MIKGIDSQIITGRTTDYMKENSARLKSDAFNQTLHSKMQNNDVKREMKTVTDVKKSETRKVDDKDDGKRKKQEQNKKEKNAEADVIIEKRINNDSNSVSGNETVGFVPVNNIDIEV